MRTGHGGGMWATFGFGLWAGFGLAIPVGAVAVLLIQRTATSSLRHGLAAATGAVTADALYALAAVIGGTAAARLITPWQVPVTVAGAGLLLFLAGRTAIDGFRREDDDADASDGSAVGRNPAAGGVPRTADEPGARRGLAARGEPRSALREALLFFTLTGLNPWPLLYFVSVVLSGGLPASAGAADSAALLAGIVIASASWHCVLVLIGRGAGRLLLSPTGRRVGGVVSASVIAALAIRLLSGL
ncbi:LysE family transporter [Brevibacterium sanguinis]